MPDSLGPEDLGKRWLSCTALLQDLSKHAIGQTSQPSIMLGSQPKNMDSARNGSPLQKHPWIVAHGPGENDMYDADNDHV